MCKDGNDEVYKFYKINIKWKCVKMETMQLRNGYK